jgi:hypothetical protein
MLFVVMVAPLCGDRIVTIGAPAGVVAGGVVVGVVVLGVVVAGVVVEVVGVVVQLPNTKNASARMANHFDFKYFINSYSLTC